jgi:hypothetical protein
MMTSDVLLFRPILSLLRFLCCLLAMLLLLPAATLPLVAALQAYEGFDYPVGASITNQSGGSGWAAGWVDNGSVGTLATNAPESLFYEDNTGNRLQTSGGRAFVQGGTSLSLPSTTPYRSLPTTLGTNDNTTTWISFLGLRSGPVVLPQPYYRRVASLQLRDNATERLALGRASTDVATPMDTWSIYTGGSGANTVASSVPLSNAPCTLVVLRIDHLAGNDNCFVFMNPQLGVEPATNSASLVTNANAAFNRIQLFAGNTTASASYAELQVDEIRVGETFADVTPYTPASVSPGIPYPATFQVTKGGAAVVLEDYATLPLSGRGGSITSFDANVNPADQLARPTFLRSEPTNAPLGNSRFFVTDLNRNLYILDKNTRTFTPYINFQSIFRKYYNAGGFAAGLNPIAFDPEYASNGIFYTAHLENPAASGDATPINDNLPALDLTGFTITTALNPPSGSVTYQSVLIEWRDTNVNNATFEGTAREIMRVGLNSRIHPMGDLLFNPLARPGDADYRNLYIAQGDGSAGENSATRTTPQRLDAVQGKILRITPDLNLRPADELSANGRYRIPTTGTDPNPFVGVTLTNLKKEIFAYGFRNCHRISWDTVANVIVENDIGLHSWEEVNLVHKGGNYGYSEREGAEQLFVGGLNNGLTGSQTLPVVPFPTNDTLVVTGLVSAVTPIYPVALYSHWDGDGISSGFVYRGSLMPGLYGKYIFGDIANGRMFYADFNEMLAADDGDLNTVATTHELQIVYNNPLDAPDAGFARWRMFDIVALTYTNRSGDASGTARLPGSAESTGSGKTDGDGILYGVGRVDLRLCQGSDNEIYIISKSDGSIRKMTASLGPPAITSITNSGSDVTLTWQSVPGWNYRVQYKVSFADPTWQDLAGDVTATGLTAAKTTSFVEDTRFYRVRWLP